MIGVLFVLMFVVISRGQIEMKGMGGFSDLMDSFKEMATQFEKMKNMKPWYQGPNACFNESYKDVPFGNGDSGPEGSAPFELCQELEIKRICSASMMDSFKDMAAQFEKMKNIKPWYQGPNAFEMCQEMELKRICSARVVIKGQAKERIRTYQCCHGSVGKYVDGWMQCVE
ncbi:hypothetical protein JTE90_016419 [Oedothorax gibbosus]|uniref:Uncharacterized protein n=1 Tax=Oedothorax gibbosus TaxID=931172 RepID=A0AAV6U5F9_9ARAC|nr:hypothetical protein JTE90_016419 [Oedothorax gibbosus]